MMAEKNRAQTLQQRFGFQDNELVTPAHDELMCELDGQLTNIAQQVWPCGRWAGNTADYDALARRSWEMKRVEVTSSVTCYRGQVEDNPGDAYGYYQRNLADAVARLERLEAWQGLGPAPAPKPARVTVKRWELPIMNKQFMVGFVDLYAMVVTDGRLEVTQYDKNTSGYFNWDSGSLPGWDVEIDHHLCYFEVKPAIRSVGEVLRQIAMYREYADGNYFVVSPDARWRDVMVGQGVGFVDSSNWSVTKPGRLS